MVVDIPGESIGGRGKASDEELRPVDAVAVGVALAGLEDERDGEVLDQIVGVGGERGFLEGGVGQILADEGDVGGGEAAGVQEEVAEGDFVDSQGVQFAGLADGVAADERERGELGEVVVDGVVEVDCAALDELQGRDVGEEFPGGGERDGAVGIQGLGVGVEGLEA